MPAERVNCPRATHHFAAVRHASWNEIFLPGFHWNLLAIDNQRVAALHHEHIFIEFMHVLRRRG